MGIVVRVICYVVRLHLHIDVKCSFPEDDIWYICKTLSIFRERKAMNAHMYWLNLTYRSYLLPPQRIQRGPVRGISLKLQEEERERRMDFIPEKSLLDVDQVDIDNDTNDMLRAIDFPSIPGVVVKQASHHSYNNRNNNRSNNRN